MLWRLITRILVAALAISAIALVSRYGSDRDAAATDVAAVNRAAPEFTLPLFGGDGQLSLSGLRGKVVLINFWASWCGPCKQALPDLVALTRAYSGDGFAAIGLIVNSDPSEARAVIEQFDVPYRNAVATRAVAENWRVESVPVTYIIDRDGVVRYRYVGVRSRSTIERDILLLLEKE